jgi:hypothetical protein
MALAPVPIMATRRPFSSTEWSQRAVWNTGPAKLSRPGIAGIEGRLSWPTAVISALQESVSVPPSPPRRTVTRHRAAASSKVASVTSTPKRMWGSRPWRSAVPSM